MTSPLEMEKSAVISGCGQYRYSLTRTWDATLPGVLFVMLNPSTADAFAEDATSRRCAAYARAWGRGSVTIVNLFAFRATNPAHLVACAESNWERAVGPDNDAHIQQALQAHAGRGDYLIAAWGANGRHPYLKRRRDAVMHFLPTADLLCLDTTRDGEPKHPLYCRANLGPVPYERR